MFVEFFGVAGHDCEGSGGGARVMSRRTHSVSGYRRCIQQADWLQMERKPQHLGLSAKWNETRRVLGAFRRLRTGWFGRKRKWSEWFWVRRWLGFGGLGVWLRLDGISASLFLASPSRRRRRRQASASIPSPTSLTGTYICRYLVVLLKMYDRNHIELLQDTST